MHRQQGVVLIMAMVMIVAVTTVAVTLMSTSSLDLKITNAAQEREMAENELFGEVQKIIAEQSAKKGQSYFMKSTQQMTNGKIEFTSGDTSNVLTNFNNGQLALKCPRQFSFTEGVVCNMTQLETTVEYGTKSKHRVTVVAGISQEMLNASEVN
ncbi:hypothetical protein PALB_4520 [Pseudoalteromonas luteoviolacea B = ATCC 29581]|nr:hypothetical protein PALB_4520 [Pseudoalteromonas luteoviolacea B = ATCC 29581]